MTSQEIKYQSQKKYNKIALFFPLFYVTASVTEGSLKYEATKKSEKKIMLHNLLLHSVDFHIYFIFFFSLFTLYLEAVSVILLLLLLRLLPAEIKH